MVQFQQFNQVSRRSRFKPVAAESFLRKSIQQAERVVHADRVFREMIAVVIGFQFLAGLFVTHPGSCSQFMDVFFKTGMDFLLTDTANLCIAVIHGYVHEVVQVTEHTDFAELRHTCQQGKADASVHGFQSPVKSLQGTAVFILQSFVADSLQHGLVVFVNEDHYPASGLFAGTADNALETPGYTDFSGRGAIKSFPILYVLFQNIGQ